VVVDDYIPCKDGRIVFSHAHDNELWVMLLEKAWAKIHGNYARIIGG
jgi:calpain-15